MLLTIRALFILSSFLIYFFLLFLYLNGKFTLFIIRLKEQPHKDQDILKSIPHAEDVIENHGIFKIKDVELADIQEVKLEDMKAGHAKLEEEKAKELEE